MNVFSVTVTPLFFVLRSLTKERGRREDRGESGLSGSSWLRNFAMQSPYLAHTHTHAHGVWCLICHVTVDKILAERLKSALRVFWQLDGCRRRLKHCSMTRSGAQTTVCRQRASALTIDTDTSMTYIWVWSDLFLIYFTECVCVCGVNNTAGLIFILEEETWCKFAPIPAVGEGTFSFFLLGGERNGWALCSTLFCLSVCHLPVPIIYCRRPEKVLCLQGCQVLRFFFFFF